ncbi:16S rRNA (guanine(966)-N(2))-methyltransferase RsmD [Mycoplasmopsis cynos]|uniref:16S rRNA (guanine(966)-N(2))-methyltransferase RsmD n=1 Tax=Mycoplasmopsis cynos TaxID=171284 RepID=UPI0024CA4088|nr:16S rRNA (guanine(966)-N(2))-methyltransferase RsmD [Mycoplasmopsis cynos]WAM04338.1 16S rRNA (guanine(966)-N(2))-methyltransferase RsmD [Mycoplasmopsis cynos]
MLRIISGKYRNRKIQEPDLKITRPTTDKVREAIFSSLQFKIIGKKCLDLFAGSGALSIEAISRGAKATTAIEKNKEVYKIMLNNINSIKIEEINTLNTDALNFLKLNSKVFDFIFIDAPYHEYKFIVNECLSLINVNDTLDSEGEIILETNSIKEIVIPSGLKVYKSKRYGRIDVLYIIKDE